MKSAVETLEPTKVKLTVEVTYDELAPSIAHAYQHIAEQVTVPGFRKGKVPPRIIDQRVGRAAVIEHAVNEGLSGFYADAVKENDLRPLAPPEVEVTAVPGLPGRNPDEPDELHFTAEVLVRPALVLPDLAGLSVSVEGTEVTDADVDERLDALRVRFGTLVGVDRPAADGDFVQLDLVANVDGEQVDQVSGVSYQVGSGGMLDGLDEALSGLSAGETTTFSTTLVGGEHAGEQADVTVTASAVKERQLPEVDDDFAQLASEFDTVEELRADLRGQAAQGKGGSQAVQARDALLAALLEQVEVPVPESLVESEVTEHLTSEGREADDAHRAEVTEETTTTLRRQILLDTLAEQLDVKVSQGELVDYLVSVSRQYGMDPNEFITTVGENGRIPGMVAEVARGKSLAVALRRVSVTDPSGGPVDLTAYIGSDAADAAAAAGPAAPAATPPVAVEAASGQVEGDETDLPPAAGSASDISGVLGR